MTAPATKQNAVVTGGATPSRGGVFVLVYLAGAILPLVIAAAAPAPPPRAVWVEIGIGLGFVGLAMMGLQFVLSARAPWLSRRIGQDTLLQFHRHAGIIAAGFIVAHPVLLILADPAYAAFFDPRANLPRAFALSAVNLALLLLIGSSMLRARLSLQYEWWRLLHGLLAGFIMVVAVAHVLMVGRYAGPPYKAVLLVLLILGPVGFLASGRVVRPLLRRHRAWRVAEVRTERPQVWTVVLEPDGAPPLRFEPGQFAWLTFAASPLALRQHPFTIASSAAHPHRLAFTIKALGDFTATVARIPPGTPVHVEGPAGGFGLPASAPGAVLIAGGIGITPMMSILRTMRDRGDRRPVTLIYGNATLEKAVFRDELVTLSGSLRLRIVHVPETPPPGWQGPHGYITRDLLAAELAVAGTAPSCVLICGPDVMMDACEHALLSLGVDHARIRSERFNVV